MKKNVPVVEPQKPTEEPEAVPADVQPDTQQEVTFPSLADIFKNVDQKSIQAAEGLGVPVKGLLLWARGMEVKQDAIIETLKKVPSVTEKGIAEELYKKTMEQRQQQGGIPPTPTGNTGGGGLGSIGTILELAKAAGIGGGGSSEMQDKIMNMALESMGLGNALVKAIILKTAPELATQLLPPLAGVKP